MTLNSAVQEWLSNNSVSVVECPDLKMPKGLHPTLTEPERIRRGQMILKSRCAKLVAVIGSKGASANYQTKGLNKRSFFCCLFFVFVFLFNGTLNIKEDGRSHDRAVIEEIF